MHASAPIRTADTDLDLWLAQQTGKGLLRFLTCGSVDDGKSTLIGRLLVESKAVFEDQVKSLEKDSRRHGTTGMSSSSTYSQTSSSVQFESGNTRIDSPLCTRPLYRFHSSGR